MGVGKWFHVAQYLGIAENTMIAFARCITRSSKLDVYDVLDDIELIVDSNTRDYVQVMKGVEAYLLSLGVPNVVRGPKGGKYIEGTVEDFATRFTPHFTGETTSGKAGEIQVDIEDLAFPIGYVHTPLSEYELELKDRRKNGYLLGDPPTMYHVYLSK